MTQSLNGEATLQLPNGPQSDSYKISLIVDITDNSDGTTQYNISTPVTVLPNYALISSLSAEILNNGNLIQTLGSGSLQSAICFINSFINVLNNQQTNVRKMHIFLLTLLRLNSFI